MSDFSDEINEFKLLKQEKEITFSRNDESRLLITAETYTVQAEGLIQETCVDFELTEKELKMLKSYLNTMF